MACTRFLFARKGAVPRMRRPRFGNPYVDAGVEQSETVEAELVDKEL